MTAPTPATDEQVIASLRNLTSGFGTEEEAADRIEALSAALAAVTAEHDQAVHDRDSWRRQLDEQATSTREEIERADAAEAQLDQARQMLTDAEKKIASMELDASLREEDERFADPL